MDPVLPTPPRLRSRSQALGALALTLLVAASFFPAFSAGLVFDDVIFTESIIDAGIGLREIWFAPREIKREAHYWPLVYTGFWLENKLWGAAPLGYHVTNLLLYAANVLLVWRLLLRCGAPCAWAAAALWAVHPLHVESVVWVIERKDVQSGLFYLASAILYLRFDESGRRDWYGLSLLLFACGLLSKSVVVTLPAAFLIWHWWKRGRVIRDDLVRTAPFFLIGFAITLADLAFYRARESLDLGYSLVERVLIASRALWFYAGKLAWPADLTLIYPLWEVRAADPRAWLFAVAAAAVPAALWLSRHRLGRGPLAGAAFFAVTLAPALGFIDYGYMQFSLVADRFQYLAGIGVLAVAAAAVRSAATRLGRPTRIGAAALLVLALGGLGTLTWRYAAVFGHRLTLFEHAVAHNPEARGARHNLALALQDAGRLREAEEHFRQVLALDPDGREALHSLAEALRRQRRYGEAEGYYRQALAVDADYALSLAGLGQTLVELRRYEEALANLDRALVLYPTALSVDAGERRKDRLYNLQVLAGRAARELGRYADADGRLAVAMEHSPAGGEALLELAALRFAEGRSEEGQDLLGRVRALGAEDPAVLHRVAESLRYNGRREEAVAAYREALEIAPDFAPSLAGLGNAMLELDRHEEAVELLERALSLDPDLPEAPALLRVLGQALLEIGRPQEAEQRFRRAVESLPPDPQALDHLALLAFQAGRYEEALGWYRRRLEAGADDARTHANMAVTLYYLKRYGEAEQSALQALERAPELGVARALLADLRQLLRRDTE